MYGLHLLLSSSIVWSLCLVNAYVNLQNIDFFLLLCVRLCMYCINSLLTFLYSCYKFLFLQGNQLFQIENLGLK